MPADRIIGSVTKITARASQPGYRVGTRTPSLPSSGFHREDALPYRLPRGPGGWSGGRNGGDVPRLFDRRYREGEPRPRTRPVALGPDTAPVRLHYSLADGKAQAGVAPVLLGVAARRAAL